MKTKTTLAVAPLPEGADAFIRSLHAGIAEAAPRFGLVRHDVPDRAAAERTAQVRLMGTDILTSSKRDIGLLLELSGMRAGQPYRIRLTVHPNDGPCFTEAEGIDPHALIPAIPKDHPRPPARRYYAPRTSPTVARSLLLAAGTGIATPPAEPIPTTDASPAKD